MEIAGEVIRLGWWLNKKKANYFHLLFWVTKCLEARLCDELEIYYDNTWKRMNE